jgi:hypothetical protein
MMLGSYGKTSSRALEQSGDHCKRARACLTKQRRTCPTGEKNPPKCALVWVPHIRGVSLIHSCRLSPLAGVPGWWWCGPFLRGRRGSGGASPNYATPPEPIPPWLSAGHNWDYLETYQKPLLAAVT